MSVAPAIAVTSGIGFALGERVVNVDSFPDNERRWSVRHKIMNKNHKRACFFSVSFGFTYAADALRGTIPHCTCMVMLGMSSRDDPHPNRPRG